MKWSNTLKKFVSKKPTDCLSVFDHFVVLVLKGLTPHKLKLLKSTIIVDFSLRVTSYK